jgi:hypothetical protein
MTGSTYVVPHVAPMTDSQSQATLGLVEAAFAEGMRVSAERQSHMTEPMGSAVPMSAQPTEQPYVPPEPGDATEAGVT